MIANPRLAAPIINKAFVLPEGDLDVVDVVVVDDVVVVVIVGDDVVVVVGDDDDDDDDVILLQIHYKYIIP